MCLLGPASTCTHTHTHTRAHAHTRTHTHMHTHTHVHNIHIHVYTPHTPHTDTRTERDTETETGRQTVETGTQKMEDTESLKLHPFRTFYEDGDRVGVLHVLHKCVLVLPQLVLVHQASIPQAVGCQLIEGVHCNSSTRKSQAAR